MTPGKFYTELVRILDALATELVNVSDAELAEVLAQLGLKPEMKGSAALFDVLGGGTWQFGLAESPTDEEEDSIPERSPAIPLNRRDR